MVISQTYSGRNITVAAHTTPEQVVDVTHNTIIKIESGVTSNPRVDTLKRIADALRVKMNDLMKC